MDVPVEAAGDQIAPDGASPGDGSAAAPDASVDAPPVWLPTTSAGAPPGRGNAGMVWTGTKVIVWGGGDYASQDLFFYNTGGVYDVAQDSWSPTSTVGAPSARYQPLTAWTGSEMIVWGGQTATDYVNDGARYNPVTNSWRPMSTAGAVPFVVPGAAVWTGQVLIVFNGEQGALYDPARDVWTAIPDPPAPGPRLSQASVWTGSDFITWGGTDATTTVCVNTGLRYRLATNVWTPTATTGAPARRCYPRVAWSGTEMLVFGGNDESAVLAGGARYNPATDTWRPMSTSGALSPRTNHAGVWTGSQFLIWGGNDARAVFNTGAAYDPAADSWTPFSVPLAVVGRFDVSAVWTGTEMIIWGGEAADLASYPSYGLRFRP